MTDDLTAGTPQAPEAPEVPTRPVVARPGRYYRWTRFIMTLVLLIYGGMSIRDGFFTWPKWPQTHPYEKPKTHMDILFNQVLGVALPPLAILLLGRALYNSRGQYRLEDGVVYVPGHPPVPLEKIQSLNRELWDRKGIAYVRYDLDGTARLSAPPSRADKNTFRLDDFVYEREPTDHIFKQIEESVRTIVRPPPPSSPAPAGIPSKLPPRPRMGSNL
jgi:hypothetical protein